MTGLFLDNSARLAVSLRAPGGSDEDFLEVEFVVDTGFVGDLTLPLAAIQTLGLPYRRRLTAHLADSSTVPLTVYDAEILWINTVKRVEVVATGVEPLLKTLLLAGCELNIRFADHEDVTVLPL